MISVWGLIPPKDELRPSRSRPVDESGRPRGVQESSGAVRLSSRYLVGAVIIVVVGGVGGG
jgi:hypothetical protein